MFLRAVRGPMRAVVVNKTGAKVGQFRKLQRVRGINEPLKLNLNSDLNEMFL